MFYDNFKKICDARGLKPTPVIQASGCPSSSIGRWKNGGMPNGDSVLKLSNYLQCSTDLLLTGHEYTPNEADALSVDEKKLIQMFRVLPEEKKEWIFDMARVAYDKEIQKEAQPEKSHAQLLG